jgi:hypothetical protein
MNKYEKLIEHIVNDEQDKARALFHEIVVEKSRDIYESLMDDEDQHHGVGGDQVGGLVDEISADEHGMHEDDEEMDMAGDEEFGTDDDMGDMDHMGGEEGEHLSDEEQTERILDLEDALEELKAEFDSLMSDEAGEEEHMGDEHMDDEEMEGMGMMEDKPKKGVNPFAKKDDEEEEEETTESRRYRSDAEKLREYVDKVSDGHGAEKKGGAEGSVVGSNQSSKPTVNSRGIVAGKNDMGGTTANIVKGGSEAAPDGTSPKGKVGGFVKQGSDLIGDIENRPGGNAGKTAFKKREPGHGSEKKGGAEGKAVGHDGSVPINKSSILKNR